MIETDWDMLISAALVGIERRPVPPTVVDAVGALVGGDLGTESEELKLLTAAGVLAAHRRAGLVTHHGVAAPREVTEVDARPEPSPAAVQLLELLVDGQAGVTGSTSGLVAEWLQRCARTGRQVPAPVLPRLLTYATTMPEIRPSLLEAGGPRLTWLAARNEHWTWAAEHAPGGLGTDEEDLGERWATGTGDERFAALDAMRVRDPVATLEVLVATWSGEKATDRARAVKALGCGLGSADEPFLESALDDRSASVRVAAAELLTTLPGSRLGQRMAGRLRPLVTLGGRLRKKLEVDYPAEPDGAARRDGIVDTDAPARTGPRAWWLIQMVGATPLAFWSDELGLAPGEVLRLAGQAEVRRGLTRAAVGQRANVEWAAELLEYQPEASLLGLLPPDQARAALPSVLERCKEPQVASVLASVPGPWSPTASRTVVSRLRAMKNTVAVEQALAPLAAATDHAIGPAIEAWIDASSGDERRRRLVRHVAHTVSIRHAIAQELT